MGVVVFFFFKQKTAYEMLSGDWSSDVCSSDLATAALAARPWLRVEWLPKCAPELNDIERSWRDLKRHYLAHRTFRDADRLDHAIHQAVDALNRERRPEVCAVISDAA